MYSITMVYDPYTKPVGYESNRIIVVPCNILGVADMPHMHELLKQYPEIHKDYETDKSLNYELGTISLLHESAFHVCDFYVMDRLSPDLVGNPLIHTDAFLTCAQSLYSVKATSGPYSIHYPLIRKEENWEAIQEILTDVFVNNGVMVYAYDNFY